MVGLLIVMDDTRMGINSADEGMQKVGYGLYLSLCIPFDSVRSNKMRI
jgi:hypothetical protein